MDKLIEELRNTTFDIEELKKRKAEIKQLALEHRDENEIDSSIEEVRKINDDIKSLEDKKIKLNEKEKRGEINNMDNTILHFTENMERADILATAEYRNAFFKKLQGRDLNSDEQRTITSAANSGGASIPTKTMDEILGQITESPTLAGLVTTLNIPELLSLPIENVTNDASWVAEATDGSSADDTLTSISLSAYKLIRLVEITAKLQAMSVSAFETWIVNTLVKKMRAAIENAIINGSGTNQPEGVEELTFNSANSIQKSDDFTYNDFVDLESLLGEDYEANAVFVMNRKTLAAIKKLKDDVKKPLFERIAEDGFRGTILGYPVRKSKYVADNVIYLADWKAAYVINFTKNVEITNSAEAGFKSGNIVYRALALVDGKPTSIANSIVKLSKV